MKRIIWHWTAGANAVSNLDRKHYHFIIGTDGVEAGDLKPEANLNTGDGSYAAHTRGTNTGAIGLSVAGMRGAVERPFNTGPEPMTKEQIDKLVELSADLSETYNIPVTRKAMLSHAEVQITLGIKQRGKWDISWLPGMPGAIDPVQVGDMLRARVKKELASREEQDIEPDAPGGLIAAIMAAFAAFMKARKA